MTTLFIGFLLAVSAAILFAVNNILIGRGLQTDKIAEGIFITIIFSTTIIFIFAVLTGEFNNILTMNTNALLLFIVTGILNFILARTFNYTGIALLGPSRNSAIVSSQILFAAFFAFAFLNEAIDLYVFIGIILSFAGIIMVSLSQETKRGFSYLGILFAFLTAFFVSISVILIREANLLTDLPIDGALISYLTALICYFPFATYKHVTTTKSFRNKMPQFLAFAGLASGLAQIARYSSLDYAPVVLVASIIASAPLITMVLSFFVNKKYEVINSKLVIGTVITVIGVILISFSLNAI